MTLIRGTFCIVGEFLKTIWKLTFKKWSSALEFTRRFYPYNQLRSLAKFDLQCTTNFNLLATTDKLFYWYGRYNYRGRRTVWLANNRLLILCKWQWKKKTELFLRRFRGTTNLRHDNPVSENRFDSWNYRIRIPMLPTWPTSISILNPKVIT